VRDIFYRDETGARHRSLKRGIKPGPGDEGRGVIYCGRGTGLTERGVISSWNDLYVFVRYTTGSTAAATRREDLIWEHEKEWDE
jgi:hypothetical protein